jgi:hypothetical protein
MNARLRLLFPLAASLGMIIAASVIIYFADKFIIPHFPTLALGL